MLISRTSKEVSEKDTPLSKTARTRGQVVSAAKIIDRQATGPSRTQRVRASEENRRMGETVENAIGMAHAAAQQTSIEQDRLERIRERRIGEEDFLSHIDRRIAEARKALGFLTDEKNDVQHQFQVLIRARDKVNLEIASKSGDLVNYELRLNGYKTQEEALSKKIGSLEMKLKSDIEANALSREQRAALESEIFSLKSRSAQYGKKIARALEKHEQTLTTIEEATASFRIFERRIGKLSRQTGFVIGYPKLEDE